MINQCILLSQSIAIKKGDILPPPPGHEVIFKRVVGVTMGVRERYIVQCMMILARARVKEGDPY